MTAKKPRKKDALDGYRGARPDQLRAAAARRMDEIEGELPEDSPYKKFILGVQAEKLIAGIATREDIAAVMAEIVKRMEASCKTHMKALMANPDLSSMEAKEAHFESRVCAALLTQLNDLIESGIVAGRALEDGDTEV